MNGIRLLEQARKTFVNRRSSYGHPTRHMQEVANRWSIVFGKPIKPQQVVICLIELKLARLKETPTHLDSIIDIAGYAAVMAEVFPEDNQGGLHHESQ